MGRHILDPVVGVAKNEIVSLVTTLEKSAAILSIGVDPGITIKIKKY